MNIGDAVMLSAEAQVHPAVRRQVVDKVGTIIDTDESFDWVVRFAEATRSGGLFAFDTSQLVLAEDGVS